MSLSTLSTMSRDEVLGDDDLLTEILIRMPPKHIYKSRFVSKRWNNLISSTSFQKTHKAKREEQQFPVILALMVTSPQQGWAPSLSEDDFTPDLLANEITAMPIFYGYKSDFFRSYSNGLILTEASDLHIDEDVDYLDFFFKVVNLQTDVCVQLPPPPRNLTSELSCEYDTSVALVYEEVESQQSMEPTYKVVMPPADMDGPIDVLPILIYSSHTGCWTESSMRSSQGIFRLRSLKPPLSINGFLHWYCDPWGIAIMNTKNVVNTAKMIDIQLIPLPEITSNAMEPYFNFGFTRSPGDDIWFAAINNGCNIKFWRLPRENHSTNSTTQIGLEDWILMDSDYIPISKCDCIDSTPGDIYKIEALIPWKGDIIVLLRLTGGDCETLYVYHRQRKSLDSVGCFFDLRKNAKNLFRGLSPVMETLTLSSYGPLKHIRCVNCTSNCEECSALVLDKVDKVDEISGSFPSKVDEISGPLPSKVGRFFLFMLSLLFFGFFHLLNH